MTTRLLLSLLVASFPSFVAASPNIPLFRFIEKQGPHPVGLRVVEQYDYSRVYRHRTDDLGKPFGGERARPLQTLIWYPAGNSVAKPMKVSDYVNLLATETSFGNTMSHSPQGAQDRLKDMKPTLQMTMWSVRNAPLAPGRFPLVIYAPSFSAKAWENADLCEYLASYGYVVIASPSMGAKTRSMTDDLTGIDAQALDISFLIGYARTLPDTDVSKVAVAGYSWGGISNLFAAARDNRIDALIDLDGSMRYYPGLVKQAGDVHPEQMTIPLLFFRQGEVTIEDQALYMNDPDKSRGPSVLNAWTHGDLVLVHMLGMLHMEFSSMDQRNEYYWRIFPDMRPADFEREDGIAGYAWVARYTLRFLDAYLKGDSAAMEYLKKTPAENGAPRHFITADFRAAKGLPPSLDAFREELGRQGFDHAGAVYAAMKKENADFKLEEEAMRSWSGDLMAADHVSEAIDLSKLNVQLYPESSRAYDDLGKAYEKTGQKELAIDAYRKSLEKDSGDLIAKEKLKELESGGAAGK